MPSLLLKRLEFLLVSFTRFLIGTLLHLDHKQIVSCSAMMKDDIRKNGLCVSIICSNRICIWLKPLHVIWRMMITIILAVNVPSLELILQIHGEPMGDGTFIAIDPEKIGILKL